MSIAIEKLINNEEFLAKLEEAHNDDEILALFKENGVEISMDDLKAMLSDGAKEELDENTLDEVSGGVVGYIVGRTVARYIRKRYFSGGGGGGAFGSGGSMGFR